MAYLDFDFSKCSWAETIRTPRLYIRECPVCGNELEIFSIDFETKCDRCGQIESNRLEERIYWCARNCAYVDECIGEELHYKIINRDGGIKKAVSFFKKGFSCASSIVHAYADRFGIDRTTALRLPSMFAAGMGLSETCGAVTGALMLIGMKFGKIRGYDMETDEKAFGHVRDFLDAFRTRNTYLNCKELLGCDINEPGMMEKAFESGLILKVCPGLVKDAAEILENIIKDNERHNTFTAKEADEKT